MTALVSLPMYAAPPDALDAFWRILHARLLAEGVADVPEALSDPEDLDAHCRDPDLLLSQTCGRPFATTLDGVVTLVATPHYDAPGCEGPHYRSMLVVRRDDPARTFADLRGRRAAFNARDSHSGFSRLFAAADEFAPKAAFFAGVVETGSHGHSMAIVAGGDADIAAIDCVTYALAARRAPELASRLRPIAWSAPSPGLPFVTAASRSPREIDRIRAALVATIAEPSLTHARSEMLLSGVSTPPASAYAPCRSVAAVADAAFERIRPPLSRRVARASRAQA